jgi:uncharacterized protein (TIGR02646 family)
MLNLNPSKAVGFTATQQAHITSLMSKLNSAKVIGGKSITIGGTYLWGLQDKMTNRIKHRISLRTLLNQDRRCAFCDAILLVGSTHIEHIVPKGLHGEYTFEPLNLVSSCASCNSPSKKGESETVKTPLATRYCDNQFLIVHPYLDNPEDHIRYKDDLKIELDYANCSQKGQATIDLFDWDNLWEQNNRVAIARTRDFDKATLAEIIAISTYK